MVHRANAGTIFTRQCCAIRGYQQNPAKGWTWHRATTRYRAPKRCLEEQSKAGAKDQRSARKLTIAMYKEAKSGGRPSKKKNRVIRTLTQTGPTPR